MILANKSYRRLESMADFVHVPRAKNLVLEISVCRERKSLVLEMAINAGRLECQFAQREKVSYWRWTSRPCRRLITRKSVFQSNRGLEKICYEHRVGWTLRHVSRGVRLLAVTSPDFRTMSNTFDIRTEWVRRPGNPPRCRDVTGRSVQI